MSAIWIEKLREAKPGPERDEILLREFKSLRQFAPYQPSTREYDLAEEVQEQLRALAELAFNG